MRTLLVASLLLVFPALATADPTPSTTTDVSQMKSDDCAKARKQHKTCVLDMTSDDPIEVGPGVPGGKAVGILTFGNATSLIRIRRDFITEILKTAEDL